jgi:hypothetical protein
MMNHMSPAFVIESAVPTLGVENVDRSIVFHGALGFQVARVNSCVTDTRVWQQCNMAPFSSF